MTAAEPIRKGSRPERLLVALSKLTVLLLVLALQAGCNRSAIRLEPISGILDAFQSHQIVALGEGLHGNNQAHAFRLALIRDPRFPAVVNDVVVEFGTARYQAVMDAFVQGAEVPYAELRKVWQDTTNPSPIWDTPIYEEFFRAVRDVNASLPPERKLRVLLGEPPVDWDAVRTHDDVVRLVGQRVYMSSMSSRGRCWQRNAVRLSSMATVIFAGTANGLATKGLLRRRC